MTNLSDKDANALGEACGALANALTMFREIQGISLRHMAKRINISPATLSRIENGEAPDLVNLIKIHKYTGIRYSILLGEEKRT